MHPGSISKWIKEDCGQPSPRTTSRDIPVGNYARCAKSFTDHVRKVLMVGTDYYVGSHPHWPERGCVVLRSDPAIPCKLMEPRGRHTVFTINYIRAVLSSIPGNDLLYPGSRGLNVKDSYRFSCERRNFILEGNLLKFVGKNKFGRTFAGMNEQSINSFF